jgi:hypothetical protein
MKSSVTQNYCSESSPSPFRRGGWGVRFTALALLALFTTCCKDDCMDPTNPDCDNYDPCYGKTQPSAKFIMEEGGMREWQNGEQVEIYYPDSVFQGSGIRFRSELIDNNKYFHRWYVGNLYYENTSETPRISFGNTARPQNITISHVIEYTPDLQCFPDDDGQDSVAQTFRLIADYRELQTYGKFEGKLSNAGQTFTFEVIPIRSKPGQPIQYWPGYGQITDVMTVNFNNEGDTLYGFVGNEVLRMSPFNHHWWFISNVNSFNGKGYIDANGNVEMNYYDNRFPYPGDTIHYQFNGTKIE